MGGFVLCKDGTPLQVLCSTRFSNLVDAGAIHVPNVRDLRISGRGKSHPILVILLALQTLWFIVQVISRFAYNLPITRLEFVTLALVLMNLLLLPVWIHKPLDVRAPIHLDLRPDVDERIANANVVVDPDEAQIRWDFRRDQRFNPMKYLLAPYPDPPSPKASIPKRVVSSIPRVIIWVFEKVFEDFGGLAIRIDSCDIPEGALSVPLFYAPDTTEERGQYPIFGATLIGALFAASHYFMGSYFPTHRDEKLWRVCVFLAASVPGSYLASFVILFIAQRIAFRFPGRPSEILIDIISGWTATVVFVSVPMIIVARTALLVESFVCLRLPPPGSLEVVKWTNYFLHLS